MLTCYFDFLTTPIITLLVGTITLILLNNKKELKTNIKILIKTSIFWGLGYGLMWILKWAIADFMYNKDTFATAMYQYIKYLGPGIIPSIILPFVIILYKIIPYGKICIKKENVMNSAIYLIIAIIPILWLIVFNNHSYFHCYFTYRNLLVTEISTNLFLLELIQVKEKKGKLKDGKNKKE